MNRRIQKRISKENYLFFIKIYFSAFALIHPLDGRVCDNGMSLAKIGFLV
ncbi:MAG: hypothetical protein SBU_000363 [Candidatus Syntrophoarchaeum butanivorans]|uniref:Uncharacterized protein n=1 Tax=Candidatus Syntropharchaeum butanivorans TaxID=1839936 RepID=A0A1F2P6X5_9EURY|nr:MAG: hypothetical protein SBU_000363 [Candidatus Syntrophoarchaeum butanivorans]